MMTRKEAISDEACAAVYKQPHMSSQITCKLNKRCWVISCSQEQRWLPSFSRNPWLCIELKCFVKKGLNIPTLGCSTHNIDQVMM